VAGPSETKEAQRRCRYVWIDGCAGREQPKK